MSGQRIDDRVNGTIALLEHLAWFHALPRRYKLIVRALKVRRLLQVGRSLKNALRESFVTLEDFKEGELLDDLRDYRLTCDERDGFRELPLCCPHFVAWSSGRIRHTYSVASKGSE